MHALEAADKVEDFDSMQSPLYAPTALFPSIPSQHQTQLIVQTSKILIHKSCSECSVPNALFPNDRVLALS